MSAPTERPCRICGGTEGNRLHHAREMMLGLRHPFDYVECAACGCVQIAEVPADLAPYYGGDYYSFASDLDAEFADPDRRASRGEEVRRLLTLPDADAAALVYGDMRRPLWSLRPLGLQPDTRVLDVGCGIGRLLYLLRLGGWTGGLGIDPYLPADRTYREGLRLRRATLAEVEGGWDVVMLHHAFEHLPDPVEQLRLARERLAPGGTVLLRLPLADSDAWRLYGPDWVQLDPPRHLFLHTRRSLERVAAEAGMRITALVHDSYDLQFWGSEQYRMDIPLHDERSYRWGIGAPLFSPEQIAAWRAEAERLNREGRGDQAAVYLQPL